jgi:hypothetical protein
MGASTRVLQNFFEFQDKDDETLPNFIKRKHPRKREKKKQGVKTKA